MNAQLIRQQIASYKSYINSREYRDNYKWEALQHFQDNWNINAPDFKTMYDKSLFESPLHNVWKQKNWYPKEIMLRFIDLNVDMVRQLFRNLFDEDFHLGLRIEMVHQQCEDLFKELQQKDRKVMDHYHGGYQVITQYLALRYPEKYATCQFPAFYRFMQQVQAKTLPIEQDLERYFKVCQMLYKGFIAKDVELLELHKKQLRGRYYQGASLLLVEGVIGRSIYGAT